MNTYTIGTKVRVDTGEGLVEGIIKGYNYGISGKPTSFFFESNEDMRFPIYLLDSDICEVLAPPKAYVEEDEEYYDEE